MMTQGWSGEPLRRKTVCTGKLVWVWGAYAFGMLWMWRGMEAAGFPPVVVWALAAVIGLGIAAWMREI